MSKARPKRVLEDVPEDVETGWAPGSAFAEGGLHIPLDSSSTSTQQDDIHRRQSVAALQKAGNVRNRLAAFEANLKLEPVEEVQVRKSWRGTWKKPKQDSPEALASPRNPISGAFAAALRKSGPAPAAAQLLDASTPLRSSTGNLASRAKEGSPFLKTVQGFLALRRSSGSGLSIASPVEQAGSTPETFSPLGSGLSTAAAAEPPAAPPQQQATTEALQHTAAQADASAANASAMTDVFERADEQQCAAKPAQEKETGLLAALAAEAALKAQEKGLKTPGECLKPSPVTPRMGANDVASSGAGPALLQGSPVMTVGTAEPTHKKKALRSPLRSPVAAERSPTLAQAPDMASSVGPPATAQTLAEASGVQPEPVPGAAPLHPWAAPVAATDTSDLAEALQAHVKDCATAEVAPVQEQATDCKILGAQAAVLTAGTTRASGGDIITASPMVEHSAPVQLEIPETQPATPQGSSDGQQASPLLMSIKKLVHYQEAVECAAVASGTSEASATSSGGHISSLECTEHLLAPACTESPSPVPQGPHGRRGAMPEADDVAGDVTSPILRSSDLCSAVAAAQARMQSETIMVQAPQQHVETADGHPKGLSETAAEHAAPPQPACGGIAEAESEAATGTVPQCSHEQQPSVADSVAGGQGESASLEQASEGGGHESGLELPEDPLAAGSSVSQAPLEQAAEHICQTDSADSTGLQAAAEKGPRQKPPAESASTPSAALSIQIDSSSETAITPSAIVPGQQPAQDAAADAFASASSFHTLASPLRPLEGLQSPELLASISPGTPADITLQQIETHGPPPSARAVGSPSGQEGLQSPELLPTMSPGTPAQHTVHHTDAPSSLPGAAVETQGEMTMQSAWTPVQSAGAAPVHGAPVQEAEDPAPSPAPTIPEGGSAVKTPLSQALATAEAQALPANTPAEAGNLPVELQPSEEAPVDDDDASSATETCESVSVCDSEAPAEPVLHRAGDLTAAGTQPVPPLDTDKVQRMLEPRSRRSFRTPERELHLPPASSLSPPQRGAADAPPFTAAAALMLRSPGARHGPLSPRSRLSPRSVPPLPLSRLFAVSPRSGSSPELDSPLEEAVEELISAACNLEDVKVPHSSSKKAGRIESLTPVGRLLLSPGEHSPMSAAAAAQVAGILAQQLQPLSPFPVGDSPALGTGYRAPQNTPAAGTASHPCSSAFHASGALSSGAPWDSAGTVRLAREQGAGSPAEAPGVQDLLAAFRRAAGQERLPASPVSAAADAALSPAAGMHADAPQASSAPPDPPAQPVSSQLSASLGTCDLPGAADASEAPAGADAQDRHDAHDSLSDTPAACVSAQEGGAVITAGATREEPAAAVRAAPATGQEADSEETQAAADASMAKEDHIPEVYDESTESPAPSEHLQMEGTQEATCQANGGALEAQAGASVIKVSGTAGSLPSTASREAAGTAEEAAAQPKMSQKGLSQDVRAGLESQSSPRTSPWAMRSPRKSGRTPRPQKLQLEDAENALTPPGSPGQLGGKSPSKLAQSLGSPSSQLLRSPLAHCQLQLSSPAPTPLCESAAKAGEQTQPEMQSPAPIAAPQMSPCPAGFLDTAPAGVPQGSTPATAPRAANPAAFLRNTNSIFSPDVPAEAGPASRQPDLQIQAPAMTEGAEGDLDVRFNLGQFSPPATRRLSTGQTPPLPAAISRSGSQAPSSRGPASTQGHRLQAHRQQHVALDMQSPAAQTPTGTALASADAERTEPESPVFDEAFALDAQLILGSMVTPGTAARPPPQRQAAPLEQVPEAASDGCGASQKAQEIVEEAAAEAGLIQGDTARLVKVMGPFLDALMGEMAEGEAQRDVLQLASQELRQKYEVLVDENRQLRKDMQELETELFQVREEHAKTEQQFKTLYRSKYLPLKEEAQEGRQDIARLKACRAADAEACEKWRAQVATQQLQIRKADTDAEASGAKLRSLQAQLQAASAAAAKAAALQEEADKAAALAAKKAARLEDQLRAAMAEKEVLVTQSAEASAKVAAAQAARDRAVKEGYVKEEESFSLKKRLQEFKRENDKFADIKAQLKRQVAQLQDDLAKQEEENKNLLHACEQLVSEREAGKSAA